MFEYSTNDKYIEGSLEYYFKDIVFQYKVYYRLKSIGRGCRLYYNHRTDPLREPDESDYYPYFKDDHDVYLRDYVYAIDKKAFVFRSYCSKNEGIVCS